MFRLLKSTPPLLAALAEYLRNEPQARIVLAIEAAYAPHGGSEVFWYYLDGDDFDCHAAYTRFHGGVTVRHCRVAASVILNALDASRFFDMPDAKSEVIDGLGYAIAVADRTRSHHVSGFGIGFPDQPQTQLFRTLTMHFPKALEQTTPNAPESNPAEQAGAGQPATRPVVEPEGGDKPQPEAEGRSR